MEAKDEHKDEVFVRGPARRRRELDEEPAIIDWPAALPAEALEQVRGLAADLGRSPSPARAAGGHPLAPRACVQLVLVCGARRSIPRPRTGRVSARNPRSKNSKETVDNLTQIDDVRRAHVEEGLDGANDPRVRKI